MDKVLYEMERLKKLYRGEEIQCLKMGRIILKNARQFTEATTASILNQKKTKGKSIKVNFNLPNAHLLREPKKNWFEIASETQEAPGFYDLLVDSTLDATGVIPGLLGNKHLYIDIPGEFYMEEQPSVENVNYALFMVNNTSHAIFYEEVESLIVSLSLSTLGRASHDGNKILVCTNPTDNYLLVPTELINGGKEALIEVWNTVYRKRR